MTVRGWGDEEVFKLINLYEQKEFLWNIKHQMYRNRDKKISAYEELASKFADCDANEVQRKIHNLRNQVSHELSKMKKFKSGDDADDRYQSRWKFFSAMHFIVPCLKPTKSTSNMNDTQENSSVMTLQDEQTQSLPKPSESAPQTSEGHKRNSKRKSQTQDDDILKEAIKIMRKPKDHLDLFGQYVASELKTMKSDYYRGQLKSEIRKAITHFVDLDEQSYWSSAVPFSSRTSTSSSSTPIPSPNVDLNCPSPQSGGAHQTVQD